MRTDSCSDLILQIQHLHIEPDEAEEENSPKTRTELKSEVKYSEGSDDLVHSDVEVREAAELLL